MIYTTCKYAPEELFAGFGEECRRLDPNPASFSCADGCAHPNLCGFAKAVIEAAQAEDVREIVLTDCCDAMRRTYDVLRRQSFDFIGFLPLPHKRGEREIRRFAADLRALADAYAAHSGRTFSRALALQACAAAMVEEVCDEVNDEIRHRALSDGFHCHPRFSPGYGDLHLEYQKVIFSLINLPKTIGLTLNSSLLMTPFKSVTALIGLAPEKAGTEETGCAACTMSPTCEYRQQEDV